jgi:hypothetical protein
MRAMHLRMVATGQARSSLPKNLDLIRGIDIAEVLAW